MVKTRFNAADVRAVVRDLRGRVLGMRVVNVYDIDAKTYLIKLAEPGKAEKVVLLLESGIRFHSTRFDRDKADMPSGFSMKLRKHIRSKRIEDISQLGIDRVVDFRFGSGDTCNHIILEMYAGGNIILTDEKYEILSLLRVHKFEENVASAVKEIYPIEHATTLISEDENEKPKSGQELMKWMKSQMIKTELDQAEEAAKKAEGGSSKKSRVKKMTLKILLGQKGGGLSMYGADIVSHVIAQAGLEPNTKVTLSKGSSSQDNDDDDGRVLSVSLADCEALFAVYDEATKVYASLDTPGQPGYIFCNGEITRADGVVEPKFEDAQPYVLNQHQDMFKLDYPSFDQAIDEYCAKFEEQKLVVSADSAEQAIKARVEKIRHDQASRIETLEAQEAVALRRAQLLEMRADDVDKALLVLRSALECGVGWDELMDYITAQQEAGNQIASLIHALRLDTSTAVILLEDDEADGDAPALSVELDINQSAHANARLMFAKMKTAKQKKQKTEEAAARVVEVAEKQSQDALNKHYQKRQLKTVRKIYWFEKFNWFITSENYLVLAGRDAQQNETLVKKYLGPGDAYVHADLHGAASCILRNKDPKGLAPLSEIALHEAGCFTVCRSAAWKSKMYASAWWVHANQVSKTAPTGEYLTTGSFMIRGKKNFLPPTPLEMGLALLFKLDDDCLLRHVDERREKGTGREEEEEDDDRIDISGNSNTGFEGTAAASAPLKLSNGAIAANAAANKEGVINTGTSKKKMDTSSSLVKKDEKEAVKSSSESSSGQKKAVRLTKKQQQEQKRIAAGITTKDEDAVEVEVEVESVREPMEKLRVSPEDQDKEINQDPDQNQTVPETLSTNSDVSKTLSNETSASSSSSFITPRERKLMKKKGWTIEKVREEDEKKKKEEELKAMELKAQAEAAERKKAEEEAEKDDHSDSDDNDDEDTRSRDTQNKVKRVSFSEKSLEVLGQEDGGNVEGAGLKANEVSATKQAGRAEMMRGKKGKSKKIKKKYKESDEQDLLLHKIAVGHAKLMDSDDEEEDTEKAVVRSKAEQTISLVVGDGAKVVSELPEPTQQKLETLNEQGLLKTGELGTFELKMLKSLTLDQQMESFRCFEASDLRKVGNKSGLMAGIMRRIAQGNKADKAPNNASGNSEEQQEEGASSSSLSSSVATIDNEDSATNESSRAHKKRMEMEMKKLLEEEGVVGGGEGGGGEENGSYIAELNKLSGLPHQEDTLLFAVPVCAPYLSISKYKYKVKLTPGEGKKGRTGKQALDVFSRSKECSPREKDLIKMIGDNEVVQCIIGDVKMSSAGLHAAHNAKRTAKKAQKNKSTK